jgi:hypothetical protein
MRLLIALAAVLTLTGAAPKPPAPLDSVATQYVKLTLSIGQKEDGYVDAYYGPPVWAEAVKAEKRTNASLRDNADRLIGEVRAVPLEGLTRLERKRRAFLLAQLEAARFRLDMIDGKTAPFRQEALALFATRVELKPLSAYDPTLSRIESLVPGAGPLPDRVEAFRMRYAVPRDRLDAVMRAGIRECRKRTLAHIKLPRKEAFRLEFVTDKPWSGYNWYKGGASSVIQINTDLPIFIERAVDLGCHEGYPGHHTENVLLEDRLVKGKGWVEFSIYPLFSPSSLIAEGSGNYGIDLAFSGDQRAAFERNVLFPLAGLDPRTAAPYEALRREMKSLAGARMTIAADYLDGKIDRPTAVRLTQKYLLVSPERAKQSIDFTDHYRSYVINYGLGEQKVRAYVERAGPKPAQRWRAMEQVLSEPTLPADLAN